MLSGIAEWLRDSGLAASTTVVALALGAWLTTYPAGWLVAWLLRSKRAQIERATDEWVLRRESRGFADGGAVIGRLERLLIYLLVLSGETGAVGFLIAAKSVFRFGELADQKNRLEAEYITIGTLMSFTVGLALSLGVRWAMLTALGAAP